MKGAFYDDVPTIQEAVTQVLKNIPKTEFKESIGTSCTMTFCAWTYLPLTTSES